MAHPLELKISQVRSRARRLLALQALGWLVGTLTAAALVVGLADYVIRFEDRGIRLMCTLAVLAAVGWACYRLRPLRWRGMLGDVQIAQRIEGRFPALTDKLASAVQFLRQSEVDPHAGSAALRRAVILETDSQVDRLDVSQVIEPRPARRALGLAGAALLAALVIVAIAPTSAWIGLVRLVRPFGHDAWPRFYSVEFREAPTRLAAGQTFEVELMRDAAHRVPDDVRMHYRYETGDSLTEEESEAMQSLSGTMVARKESVTRPFWYRAEGGDDQSMPWIRLEVLEPPRLDSLELSLHPPQYTGLPVESSEKSIHALRGTRVAISGTSTKKLRAARIQQENGPELAAELTADAYGFGLGIDAEQPFVIDKSGPYWIVLEDSEGLSGGNEDRWDIRAIADAPPSVTIEHPASNIFVTPQGEVPMRIAAKDDLAIARIALRFSRSDRTDVEDFAVPLFEAPPTAPAREAGALAAGGQLGESRAIDHRWRLADLNLKPGTQITFSAVADDYLPQTGKSTVRKVSIITPQELEDRLAQRQTLIFGELQRVLKMQQDARTQTKALEIQLDQVGRLNKQDVDNAQAAELNQRQITRTLTSPTEGIPAQIDDFMADLASNRVDSPDMQRHMRAIADELARLHEQYLTEIERDLTGVIKAAQSKLADAAESTSAAKTDAKDPRLASGLTAAGRNQDQVIESLEHMLGELGQWDNYRRFARDIAQLQHDQDEIARATKEIGQKTLSRDLKDLDAQQQADLKKLSAQQIELSRRLEKTQQQMAQMAASLKQTDPLSAATVSDALHQAQQQAISGQMRQSSEQLEKNQIGQAAQRQAKIAKDLEDLMSVLSNRREQELARLVQQLRESEQELAAIREKQMGLRKQMDAVAQSNSPQKKRELERLAREQKQLEEETGRLARRLERLQAEKAGRSATNAAGKMGQSGDAGQRGDAANAEQQAEQAEKDLEEAQQQLAERRRQAEEDLAREQLARIEDDLKSLHERQAALIGETRALEQARAAGTLTRAKRSTIRDLARQQASLKTETGQLADKLSAAEVVHMALDGAARQMSRAAESLSQQDTGAATQAAQEAARLRFAQLLSAFENKPKGEGGEAQEGNGGGGGGGSKGAAAPDLAQLKLLKILQEDLNSRYRELTSDKPRAADDLVEIASEQGKLAELALKLSQPVDANPEDDPEKLPDVRDDESGPGDAVPGSNPKFNPPGDDE